MKQTIKRLTALILAMAMALSLLSVSVWANEDDSNEAEPEISAQAEVEDEAEIEKNEVEVEDNAEIDAGSSGNQSDDGTEDDDIAGVSKDDNLDDTDDNASLVPQDADDDDECFDEDDIEQPVSDTPQASTTPSSDTNGSDWRLPEGSSELYLKFAQAVIDGKDTPDFDVHFEYAGVTIDYTYNGDGTYTLTTKGSLDNGWSKEQFNKAYNLRYDSNRGICVPVHGENSEYLRLRAPAYRTTKELQARYEEMERFYNSVDEFASRFFVSKIYCDTTETKTYTFNADLTYQKKVTKEYKGVSVVVAPFNSDWEDSDLINSWNKTVKEFTFGPHVKTASGVCYCPNLSKFSWGDSNVTEIGDLMFHYTPNLKEIRIPATVKQLGYYVYEKKNHFGFAGPDGAIGREDDDYSGSKTVVFEGDIVLGSSFFRDSILNSGFADKIEVQGNLTIHPGCTLWAKTIEIKKNFKVELDPSMKSDYHKNSHGSHLVANVCANNLKIGGNADFGGCDCVASSVTIGGNAKVGGIKPYGVDGMIHEVKKMKVNGDLYLHDYNPLGDDLEKITVGGKVTQSKGTWDGTVFMYYPIKSHGTTKASEAIKKSIQMPMSVTAKSTGKGKVKLKWKNANKVGTGIEIWYMQSSSTHPWTKKYCKVVKLKGSNLTSATISGLKSGKSYTFRIRTLGKNGQVSAWEYPNKLKVKVK